MLYTFFFVVFFFPRPFRDTYVLMLLIVYTFFFCMFSFSINCALMCDMLTNIRAMKLT